MGTRDQTPLPHGVTSGGEDKPQMVCTLSKGLLNKDRLAQTVVTQKEISRLTRQQRLWSRVGEFGWRVNNLIYIFQSRFAFRVGSIWGKDKNRRGKASSSHKLMHGHWRRCWHHGLSSGVGRQMDNESARTGKAGTKDKHNRR